MKHKKQYPILILIVVLCLAVALLIAFTGADARFGSASSIRLEGYVKEAQHQPPPADFEPMKPLLVLYSPGNSFSEKYAGNLCQTLDYLKWDYQKLDIGRTESESYPNYSMVVIATDTLEQDMTDDIRRIMRYVKDGGQLFFGTLQTEYGRTFSTIYHQLGIHEYSGYADYDSLYFQEDLLVGTTGQLLQNEDLSDTSLRVKLLEGARVYLSTGQGKMRHPCSGPSGTEKAPLAC